MSSENNAQVIADLAVSTAGNHKIGDNGTYYAIVPQGYKVESLEAFQEAPSRIKAAPKFISLESFCRYVSEFKEVASKVFLHRNGNAFAVLDYHSVDGAEWGTHRPEFHVTYSERWTIWDGRNKSTFAQRQFAEFVEDNLTDFYAPQGADMLDIAKTLHAEQNSKFGSAVRLENGDVHFEYTKTTTARAGEKNEVDIPSQFTIGVPVLEGEPLRQVPVRLRYELAEGKLTFSYEILQRAALLEAVRRSIEATIANETEIKPLLVA